MDAYNYATNIATLFFDFISSGVATVLLPAYVKKQSKEAINSFLSIIYTVVVVILFTIYVFRYPIINLLTNREIEFVDAFGKYMLIVFAIQACISLLLVLSAYYQSKEIYVLPKVINFLANLGVLLFLIVSPKTDIAVYFKVVFVGVFSNLIVDYLIANRKGFSYKICFNIKLAETRQMLKVFVPTLLSCGVFKLHTFIDTMITTNLEVGALTVLTYSTQVSGMITNFAVGNLLTYAYPKIVQDIPNAKDNQMALRKYIVAFYTIVGLLLVGFWSVGHYGINLVYMRGAFTNKSAYMLYLCSLLYLIGQLFIVIRDLIFRYYYANENTKPTVSNSILSCIVNIVLSIVLAKIVGAYGVVLGTVISGLLSTILIIIRMDKEYGIAYKLDMFKEIGKCSVVIIMTIFVLEILKHLIVFENNIVAILVWGVISVIVYVLGLILLKCNVIKEKL